MFWQKRTTHKFPLLIFGLIAVGIIVSTVFLLFILFQNQAKQSEADQSAVLEDEVNLLAENYLSTMQALKLKSQENLSPQTLREIKTSLLTTRVPKDYRQAHLALFLGILEIEESSDLTVEAKQVLLADLFAEILASAEVE